MKHFFPYRIIEAIFNRLNLRFSQKAFHLDTFLNKSCSTFLVTTSLKKLTKPFSFVTP